MDRPLVFVDLETATDRGAPHLLELGALRVVHGDVVDTFESLVRPDVPIDPGTSEVHGLLEEDVRDAPTCADVLARFSAWLGDDWLVAHDARRDGETLGFEYTRARLEPPSGALLCSLKLARAAFPEAADHKLATLAEHLDLDEGRRHRALADATLCWQITEAAAERLALTTSASLLAACGSRGGSIATSGPTAPRMKPRWRPLERALAVATPVDVLVGRSDADGDLAPARIRIVPRLLYKRGDHSWLEAECPRTGTLETFSLDRIVKVLEA